MIQYTMYTLLSMVKYMVLSKFKNSIYALYYLPIIFYKVHKFLSKTSLLKISAAVTIIESQK